MKTISFQKLLDGIMTRAGMDPAVPENSLRAGMIADIVTDALGDAWTFYPWPDVVLTEERTPTGTPAKLIYFIQDAKTTIGEVLHVFRENPVEKPRARQWEFIQDEHRAEITDSDYTSGAVWVQFRVPAPVLAITPYSAAQTYAVGDVVFHSGDCYMAKAPLVLDQNGQMVIGTSGDPIATTPSSLVPVSLEPPNTNAWDRQEIPAFLADYLKAKALASLLYAEAQDQRAMIQEQRAEGALVKAMDDFWLRRGAVHPWSAVVSQYTE